MKTKLETRDANFDKFYSVSILTEIASYFRYAVELVQSLVQSKQFLSFSLVGSLVFFFSHNTQFASSKRMQSHGTYLNTSRLFSMKH